MKTYKHKTQEGFYAKQKEPGKYQIVNFLDWENWAWVVQWFVPAILIENSSDRELQKEKVKFCANWMSISEGKYYIHSCEDVDCDDRIVTLHPGYNWRTDWTIFETEKQARLFDAKLCAIHSLRMRSAENDGMFIPDWKNDKQEKWFVKYHAELWLITDSLTYRAITDRPYYSCEAKAYQAQKDCKTEFGILFDLI